MKLNENWNLEYDENNVILINTETKEREKDGVKEKYETSEKFYFPTIKSALTAFLQKYIKGSQDAKECLSRIGEVELMIQKL